MSDRFFLDTNVLVYAYDAHAPEKQARARAVLLDGIERECAVISTQVIAEFFVVVTRVVRHRMTASDAGAIIDLLAVLPVVEIDLVLIRQAIRLHQQFQLSYWDAQILAAAQRAGCACVLSEDFSGAPSYNGIRVSNPFDGRP